MPLNNRQLKLSTEQKKRLLNAARVVKDGDNALLSLIEELQKELDRLRADIGLVTSEIGENIRSSKEEREQYAADLAAALETKLEQLEKGIREAEKTREEAFIAYKQEITDLVEANKLSFDDFEKKIPELIPEMPVPEQVDLTPVYERIKEMEERVNIDPIDIETEIVKNPYTVRDALELLNDDDRLSMDAIDNLNKTLEKLEEKIKNISSRGKKWGGLTSAGVRLIVADVIDTEYAASLGDTFEKVSKNLASYPSALAYSGSQLSTITYTTDGGTITKTLGYSGSQLTTITLSGDLPSGLTETVKTLSYTGSNLTGVTYS